MTEATVIHWDPLGFLQSILIALGGLFGGFMNTAATGGGLLSFLALTLAGVPALQANVTNLVVMPSSFVSGLRKFKPESGDWAAIAGAAAGTLAGVVLVSTLATEVNFRSGAPWMLLMAAFLLVIYPRIERRWPVTKPRHPLTVAGMLFPVGIYAGVFGGAVGALALFGLGLATGWAFGRANEAKVRVCLATSVVGSAGFLLAATFGDTALINGWAALLLIPTLYLGGEFGTLVRRRHWIDDNRLRRVVIGGTLAGAAYLIASV